MRRNSSFLGGLLLAAAAILITGCSKPPPSKESAAAHPAPTAYYKVDSATAGVISGRVLFEGKRPPRKAIDMSEDADCS
ncbi:MAG TPA: hypothetical protein VG168_05160, partial [Bryobacteraceae bacterium]|nr:hypothetical protein [Bryobacteraceae bacterium]